MSPKPNRLRPVKPKKTSISVTITRRVMKGAMPLRIPRMVTT
jgi:hypothetical protein